MVSVASGLESGVGNESVQPASFCGTLPVDSTEAIYSPCGNVPVCFRTPQYCACGSAIVQNLAAAVTMPLGTNAADD